MQALGTTYNVSVDWDGKQYCGLQMEWDYVNRTCDVSMPGYVERMLHRFNHATPANREDAPHDYTKPNYGCKQQLATTDEAPRLDEAGKKRIQEIVGTLLYYARAVDSTLLPALNTIAAQQANATKTTWKEIEKILIIVQQIPIAPFDTMQVT